MNVLDAMLDAVVYLPINSVSLNDGNNYNLACKCLLLVVVLLSAIIDL